MKTIQSGSTAIVSGGEESARLTIEANGKAFKELISGIYSDKTYAIARELVANAVDAHIANGNPERPFDLHLPTVFDPTFAIRDYGTSMDHETVMTLYRTLFRSSKDDPNSEDSNKFVGKFGLGSKSPFSYTDAFQLTAFLDGFKRVYDIYFNAGSPMITLFLNAPMEEGEEDGVLITFPVEAKDVDDFARAAQRALEPLEVQPRFTGREVAVTKREAVFSGDGWRLVHSTASGKAEAQQGTVLYPLSFQSIPNCPPELADMIASPFQIQYKIGDLDVITSREALSYDDNTAKNIVDRLLVIRNEIRDMFLDKLKAAKTYYEFNLMYYKIKSEVPTTIWRILESNAPKFKGRYRPTTQVKAKIGNILHKARTLADGEVVVPAYTEQRCGGMEMTIYATNSVDTTYNRYIGSYESLAWKPNAQKTLTLPVKDPLRIIIIFQDEDEKVIYADARVKKFIEDNRLFRAQQTVIYWVRGKEKRDMIGFKRILAMFGRPKIDAFHYLRDLPKPEREKADTTRHDYKVWSYGEWVAPQKATLNKEVYYVHIKRGAPIDWKYTEKKTGVLFKEMQKRGIIGENASLIGIPPRGSKRGDVNSNWLDFIATCMQAGRSFYSRRQEVFSLVDMDKMRRTKGDYYSRRPPIYSGLRFSWDDIARKAYGKAKNTNLYSTAPKDRKEYPKVSVNKAYLEPYFRDLIAGTSLEPVFQIIREQDAVTEQSSNHNTDFMHMRMNFNKQAIEQEEAIVRAEARKMSHYVNVIGGKACEDFPEILALPHARTQGITTMIYRMLKRRLTS